MIYIFMIIVLSILSYLLGYKDANEDWAKTGVSKHNIKRYNKAVYEVRRLNEKGNTKT